jgi:tetratricopeptide (TPR) repeat protein/DNA-binding MarR family transcriptional regulator
MVRLVVSQNERILLLLLEMDRYRDEADVPMLVCQEGIAEQLGTQVHNASRSLSSLQGEGLVESRLAHVRGAPKRRRAYFLTYTGRTTAEGIRNDLLKRTVTVKGPQGATDITVKDLLSSRSRPGLSLSKLVELALENDIVELEPLGPDTAGARRPLSRSLGRPKVGTFVGREAERKSVRDGLARGDPLVLIWGLPGIGKSALASKLYEELEGSCPVFWYTVREWDTAASVMKELVGFLKAAGRGEAYGEWMRSHELHDLFPVLAEDLAALRGVLFLDDVQKASGDARSIVTMLIEAARARGGSKVVLLSRSVPGFLSVVRPDTTVLQLEGLDDRSAETLARSLGPPDLEKVLHRGHRHPLFIQLLAKGSAFTGTASVTSFIEGEITVSVSAEESRALEFLSVYREPVGLEALPGVATEAVGSLRKQGLVLEDEDGLAVHEVIRDHFLSRTSADNKVSLHRSAAQYYEGQEGGAVEAMYHWLAAKDDEAAINLFLERAEEALENPQEVLSLTSSLRPEDAVKRAEISFWRGEALSELSRFQEALEEYSASVARPDVLPKELAGRAYGGIAQAQKETGRWRESLASHEKALEEFRRRGDRMSQAHEWLSIGSVHRKMGDHARAVAAYERAVEVSGGDPRIHAASLNNRALLAWEDGATDRAEALFKEALKLAHGAGDRPGEARTLYNLIELYLDDYRLDEMRLLLLDSSPLLLAQLENGEVADLVDRCDRALAVAGRGKEAVAMAEEIVNGYTSARLRDPRKELGLLLVLVRALREAGRLEQALAIADRGAKSRLISEGNPLKAKFLLEKAMALEDRGRLDEALSALALADDMLRRQQVLPGQLAVALRRGIIEERRGNKARAGDLYRQALLQAERLDDRLAMARASESLGRVLDQGSDERMRVLRRAMDIYSNLGMETEAEELRELIDAP